MEGATFIKGCRATGVMISRFSGGLRTPLMKGPKVHFVNFAVINRVDGSERRTPSCIPSIRFHSRSTKGIT